jgi:hypothetical protein
VGVLTLEAFVDHGQIQLRDKVVLPEHATVYVIVPDVQVVHQTARIISPRLTHPEQVADFAMEVVEESTDAVV